MELVGNIYCDAPFVYLVQPAAVRDTTRYKVGMSTQGSLARVRSYGAGTRILEIVYTETPRELEAALLAAFRDKYGAFCGNEYFQHGGPTGIHEWSAAAEREVRSLFNKTRIAFLTSSPPGAPRDAAAGGDEEALFPKKHSPPPPPSQHLQHLQQQKPGNSVLPLDVSKEPPPSPVSSRLRSPVRRRRRRSTSRHKKMIRMKTCDKCGHTCRATNYRRHYRTCKGAKKTTCDYCGRTFNYPSRLVTHLRTCKAKRAYDERKQEHQLLSDLGAARAEVDFLKGQLVLKTQLESARAELLEARNAATSSAGSTEDDDEEGNNNTEPVARLPARAGRRSRASRSTTTSA